MDIDSDELDGYLGSSSFVPTDLASAHLVAEDAVAGNPANVLRATRNTRAFGQSDGSGSGADMDAMVAERRRSLANGFGMGYLSMGEEEAYAMVSPAFAPPRMPPTGVPTTLGDVIDLSDSGMMGYTTVAPDMQASMSMYSNRTGSITPRATISSPVESIMASVPPSPVLVHRPQRSLSNAAPQDMNMQQPSIDQPMVDQNSRSIPGMCCLPGFTNYDNVTYGYSEMVQSSGQPLTIHAKQTQPQAMPPVSIFPEGIYSSSGFDMLDILVNKTPPSEATALVNCRADFGF